MVTIAQCSEVANQARGKSSSLVDMAPELQMEYTEKTFRETVFPWTWEVEMDQLLSSNAGNIIAAMLFQGEEQQLQFHLTNHLVAGTFFDDSMHIMAAQHKQTPVGGHMHCDTW